MSRTVVEHAVHQRLEVRQVGDFAGLLVGELGDQRLRVAAGDLPGVDGLHGTTAGARAQHRVDAIAADGFTGGLALGVLFMAVAPAD